MTRKKHDQMAKEFLKELLIPLGKPESSSDVNTEGQQIDVLFEPSGENAVNYPYLGLIANLVKTVCLFEVFRNPPTDMEVHSCKLKLYAKELDIIRESKRENRRLRKDELPFLWIFTPTYSAKMLAGFGAKERESSQWGKGIYFFPKFEKTAIVVINQLPENPETILLRILGKGGTQNRAINELPNLPLDNKLRRNIMDILANWYASLTVKTDLSQTEQEEFMQLTDTYLKVRDQWKEEGRNQGLQTGLQQGENNVKKELISNSLRVKFGTLDEDLINIIEEIMKLSNAELTILLMNINNISREDLLARFS